MKIKRPLPSRDLLHEVLEYNPETGDFFWKRHRFQTPQSAGKWAGKSAGSIYNGYRFIAVPGFYQIGAHRLAWIYQNGDIPPEMEVDHKDRNPLNNRIDNLRLATFVDNARNCFARKHNRLGIKGVTQTSINTFYARVHVDGHEISLGRYRTAGEATAARVVGEAKYYGEFS